MNHTTHVQLSVFLSAKSRAKRGQVIYQSAFKARHSSTRGIQQVPSQIPADLVSSATIRNHSTAIVSFPCRQTKGKSDFMDGTGKFDGAKAYSAVLGTFLVCS